MAVLAKKAQGWDYGRESIACNLTWGCDILTSVAESFPMTIYVHRRTGKQLTGGGGEGESIFHGKPKRGSSPMTNI